MMEDLPLAAATVKGRTRALSEMAYEFDAPFVLDTTKYQATFGNVGTALPTAIAETATWYRSRTSSE